MRRRDTYAWFRLRARRVALSYAIIINKDRTHSDTKTTQSVSESEMKHSYSTFEDVVDARALALCIAFVAKNRTRKTNINTTNGTFSSFAFCDAPQMERRQCERWRYCDTRTRATCSLLDIKMCDHKFIHAKMIPKRATSRSIESCCAPDAFEMHGIRWLRGA